MTQTAKFPGVLGTVVAAITDFFGEHPSQPANELVLLTGIDNAILTAVATTNIPASWPQPGRLIIDGEVIPYTSYAGATFTLTSRGAETGFGAGAAAIHSAGAVIGNWVTAQAVAQILAEIISLETVISKVAQPNLVSNGDFGKATTFGLAMGESFTDANGYTVVAGAGGVAGNIFTATNANTQLGWCNRSFVWRDGRASGTFKAVATAGIYQILWRVDNTHFVSVKQNNGNFTMTLANGGAEGVQATTALALTLNRWYWLEINIQGNFCIVAIWDTGGTVSGVVKPTTTPTATLGPTNLGVNLGGANPEVFSDQNGAQWGGVAASPGGLYVETWLPESWTVAYSGTLGGQAIGYDDTADVGPFKDQAVMRGYIPHTSRGVNLVQIGKPNSIAPSTTYMSSIYAKMSGLAPGATPFFDLRTNDADSAGNVIGIKTEITFSDAEAAWTRKTGSYASASTARRLYNQILLNYNANCAGTAWFTMPQMELGTVVTAWRNSPEDVTPTVWTFTKAIDVAATAAGEIDSRDLAANLRIPWDCSLSMTFMGTWNNSGANANDFNFKVGAGIIGLFRQTMAAGVTTPLVATSTVRSVAAGKTRVAAAWGPVAGTANLLGATYGMSVMTVTATRGK